jgi:NADP-dependent 3-hydroxy acid dehydrogenase YdfG
MRDKVTIITGASSGIGMATSTYLAAEGARLVLASRSAEDLKNVAERLPGALAVPTDVTKREESQRLVDTAVGEFGRIDILINCAAMAMFATVDSIDLDEYHALIELNVLAPLHLMQRVIPIMRAQGGGTIVNVSSMASRRYIPNIAGYASTKYALNALSLTAREELAGDNITVSIIRPTLVDTDFGRRATRPEPEALRFAEDGKLLPHVLSPQVVAKRIGDLIRSGEAELDVTQPE